MQSIERPRQYVSPARLYAMFPVLGFSYLPGAYVLRVVGESRGPVLRKNRRRRQRAFAGTDRRAGAGDLLASRPVGNVRPVKAPRGERPGGGGRGEPRAPPPAGACAQHQAQPRRAGSGHAPPSSGGPTATAAPASLT